jgi:hypothetical protein
MSGDYELGCRRDAGNETISRSRLPSLPGHTEIFRADPRLLKVETARCETILNNGLDRFSGNQNALRPITSSYGF